MRASFPRPLFLFLSIVILTGCQTGSPVEDLGNQDRITLTTVGAGIGAVGGAIIGHQSDHAAEGAAIGALVGGGIGYIVGDTVAKRRLKFVSDAAYIDDEILKTRDAIVAQEERNANLHDRLTTVDRQMNELEILRYGRVQRRNESAELIASLDRTIDNNRAVLGDYNEAIGYLEELLMTSEDEYEVTVQQRNDLQRNLDELKTQYAILIDATEEFEKRRVVLRESSQ